MADEQNCSAFSSTDLIHLSKTFLLKLSVPNREYFIHDEDLGVQVRGHCEREPHVHPA